jgi:hypothetical protein
MNPIRTLPRNALRGYLRALHLPLTATQRIVRQQDNETWLPALAFEKLEARVESLAGFVLRDEELSEAGVTREAKIAKLNEARTLKAAADVEKAGALKKQRKRDAEIAIQRGRTERVARERKQTVKAEAEQKKRAAEQEAAKKEGAVGAQQAAQEKVTERRARAAKSEALRAESEALDLTDEALKAQDTVDLIDETIEGNREARKTGAG